MEIIKKDENGIEFYTIDLTGQSGMSQSGLAILAGVDQSTISRLEDTLMQRTPSEFLNPFVGKPLTLMLTEPKINGKPVGNLIIYKSSFCAAVLKHYASPPRSNPTAVVSSLKFMEMGIDSWIQDITGWKQRRESLKPHTDVYLQRIENMRDHDISDDLWMIFREASELLLLIEKDWRVPINEYDILDGSVGKRWKDYRLTQQWATQVSTYQHQYRDQRGLRDCNAYELTELPYFRRWLKEVYIPNYLPGYLVKKYGKQAVRQIYTEIGSLNDHILEITEIKILTPKEEQKFADFLRSRQSLLSGI
jgi:hypothetical protein